MDDNDVGMVECGSGLGLLDEPLPAIHFMGKHGLFQLNR